MFNGNTFRDQKQLKVLKKYKSASDLRKINKKKVVQEYLAQKSNNRRYEWLADLPAKERTSKFIIMSCNGYVTRSICITILAVSTIQMSHYFYW